MGGTLVHTIGMVRAKAKIGMKNLPKQYPLRSLTRIILICSWLMTARRHLGT